MIPYILADNPEMSKDEAFALSKKMMDGQKWNAFVLDLSFIGWELLSVLTCGLLSIFYVDPYRAATNAALYEALKHTPPDRAVILNVISKEMNMEPFSSFEIIESEKDSGDIFVSPDIAICEECKKELFDKNNRRYMHPFINCTNCGPRLTILDSMPYDRERTSMKEFPMCPECEYEYTHPETRRYDAQPVCCPNCGPTVYAFDPKNNTGKTVGSSAITAAAKNCAIF